MPSARARVFVLNSLVGLVVFAGCGPKVDLAKGLQVLTVSTGWYDAGLVNGQNKLVSISIWETREQAQKAATVAQTWVQANMADRIRLVTSTVGDLALFHGAPVAA